MGEKNNDGGQYFTPREVIRAIVRVVEPKFGETVFDPACGTGGFLALAYEHMCEVSLGDDVDRDSVRRSRHGRTFYGKGERESDISNLLGESDSARRRPTEYLARKYPYECW